jgi:hypothetical protein
MTDPELDIDSHFDVQTKEAILAGVTQLWHPGGIAEMRCVKSGRNPTLSAYYNDPLLLAKSAYAIDRSGRTPYITLNRVKSAAWARSPNLVTEGAEKTTADIDIERRTKLFIDLDPRRPSGISASDAEHEATLTRAYAIREYFRERGWPDPFLNDSGNGHYVIYRTDEPNDSVTKALFQAVNKALGLKFSDEMIEVDQGVFNAARIAKIPGVMSDKGYDIESVLTGARISSSTSLTQIALCRVSSWRSSSPKAAHRRGPAKRSNRLNRKRQTIHRGRRPVRPTSVLRVSLLSTCRSSAVQSRVLAVRGTRYGFSNAAHLIPSSTRVLAWPCCGTQMAR